MAEMVMEEVAMAIVKLQLSGTDGERGRKLAKEMHLFGNGSGERGVLGFQITLPSTNAYICTSPFFSPWVRLHHFKINAYFLPNKSNLVFTINISSLLKMWMKLPNLNEKVDEYD